jgi:hypothetical protein
MIRELRITADALLEVLSVAKGEPPLPGDARVTDVALDHHHKDSHRGEPPTIVLQVSSNEFGPENAGRPLLPMSFRR